MGYLAIGLGPFVNKQMTEAFPRGGDWVTVLAARNPARYGAGRRYSLSDPRFLLRVVTDEWRMFKGSLSRVEQSYASELRAAGDRWAHREPFSDEDTHRTLDTLERLLTAVGAAEQAGQVRALRLDLHRPTTDSAGALADTPGNATQPERSNLKRPGGASGFWSQVGRADVVRAIEEYDRLGQEAFLAEYGFGRATAYLLIYGGRSYDSKAILGVAYKFATGVRIGPHEFSGGVYGAAGVLRRLGFDVRDTRTSAHSRAREPTGQGSGVTEAHAPTTGQVRSVAETAGSADSRGMTVDAAVLDPQELGPFRFRWPDAYEDFEVGWDFSLTVNGARHRVRHGIGGRDVYGRWRVHTVTWLDGEVQVEGVEADDYPTSRALISQLKHADKTVIRNLADVPDGYEGFDLVEHRLEIDAKYAPHCIAMKAREDDLLAWAVHAWLRMRQRRPGAAASVVKSRPASADAPGLVRINTLPPPPAADSRAVADRLLAHGRALAAAAGGAASRFTPGEAANALIHNDPFAFLIAVICDQGIVAERAWAVPYELRRRLGHLDAQRMAADPQVVVAAFGMSPALHRFVNQVAEWVLHAARVVTERYGGDAAGIWNDRPSAAALRSRFDAFAGIGQKKAAMAVEILERDLHVPLSDLSGSDIAYDVHVRRVFLRAGLARRDDVDEMVAAARALHPQRPGELDNPAWDIGRRWCHPRDPDCPGCPLVTACPRLIERGNAVKGA
jgi:uncharacterized HhH-GPD family protein